MIMEWMMEIIGWAGAACVLTAYTMVSLKKITPDGKQYQWLNIVGALCLATNAGYHGAMPSAILNAVWMAIGFFVIFRIAKS